MSALSSVSTIQNQAPRGLEQQGPASRLYSVKAGDNLEKISKSLTASGGDWRETKMQILDANPELKANPNRLNLGQQLKIPTNVEVYQVVKGDTLSSVARSLYGDAGKWKKLAEWNNISSPYKVQVGQDLRYYPSYREPSLPSAVINPKGPTYLPPYKGVERAGAADITIRKPARREVSVSVPWVSQFDKQFKRPQVACYRACREMMSRVGVYISPNTEKRIQVAVAEERNGRIIPDPVQLKKGIDYIDSELDANRPVTVGVSHKDASYNADELTDHFVVIYSRGVDGNGLYYKYHDPSTSHHSKVKDHGFRIDPKSGNLVHEGSLEPDDEVSLKHKELSMVILNQRLGK